MPGGPSGTAPGRGESPDLTGLRIREAARAIVVSADDHVVLVRFEFPDETVWALPGGGLEPGESHADALRRELHEELGLVDAEIGPHVWSRVHVVPFVDGRWDGQRERIHLVRVPERFPVRPSLSWEQLRTEFVHEIRWVPVAELESVGATPVPGAGPGEHGSGPWLKPGGLPTLLRSLLADGPPSTPLDVPV